MQSPLPVAAVAYPVDSALASKMSLASMTGGSLENSMVSQDGSVEMGENFFSQVNTIGIFAPMDDLTLILFAA